MVTTRILKFIHMLMYIIIVGVMGGVTLSLALVLRYF